MPHSPAATAVALISDIHSNLEALTAVLAHIEAQGIAEIYCLGDVVGYGASPNECLALVRQRCRGTVAGNHDWACVGLTDTERFNPTAALAVHWTQTVLAKEHAQYLSRLPLLLQLESHNALLVHGAPREPQSWQYLYSPDDTMSAFGDFSERICAVGHTHTPFIAERSTEGRMLAHALQVKFTDGARYVVNAGSVGQPRDRDPRASYAIIDSEGIRIERVEYDIAGAQGRILEAGLPEALSSRLASGR